MGIRRLEFSPNKQYILGGWYDCKLRVYNALSWSEIFALDHSIEELNEFNTPEIVNIYSESEAKDQHGSGTYYKAMARPFTLPVLNS